MNEKTKQGTIVVPWSFSNPSLKALIWAVDAVDDPTLIRVLHIAAPVSGPDNGILYEAAENQKRRELEVRFREQVSEVIRFENIQFSVEYGHHLGQEVIRFAERNKAGLIVMASTNKKGISKFFSGCLAERVVRNASCPVLVLQGVGNGDVGNGPSWRSVVAQEASHDLAVPNGHGL